MDADHSGRRRGSDRAAGRGCRRHDGRHGGDNARLQDAGALIAAVGLDEPARGAVVHFGGTPYVTDGPYGEIEELFNGFWIVLAVDLAAATVLAAAAPLAEGMHLEVRRVHGDADLG